MWKILFLFVFIFWACLVNAFARTADWNDSQSTYGSYRTDSIAATDSIPSTYGSEPSDAIARAADSDDNPSTYGSQMSDSVAITANSRSTEVNWPRIDFCPGENENRFANEYAPNANPSQRSSMPTENELAGFTNQQLSSFIASVSQGYIRDLGQFNHGDTWVKYLKLNELQSANPQPPTETMDATPSSLSATSQNQKLFSDILGRMEFVAKNKEYQAVTDTGRFKTLHAALQEASRPPEERTASVLQGQAEKLNKALDQLSTGEGWRNHLEINTIEKLTRQKKMPTDENLTKITTKFDRVAKDPAYQAIVQLPGFQGVYSSLHDLTEGRQPQFSAKREPPSTEDKNRK